MCPLSPWGSLRCGFQKLAWPQFNTWGGMGNTEGELPQDCCILAFEAFCKPFEVVSATRAKVHITSQCKTLKRWLELPVAIIQRH